MSNEPSVVEQILGKRILKILAYLLVAAVLSLIALWIWSGGFTAVARVTEKLPSFFENPWGVVSQLSPFGSVEIAPVPDTFGTSTETDSQRAAPERATSPIYTPAQLEQQYEELRRQASDAAFYGTKSPYFGAVRLSAGQLAGAPSEEYLIVTLEYDAPGPVSLTGWSLQSALSGQRYTIGTGAAPFIGGVVNALKPIVLEGGERALITSGLSPIGVSFRENLCTGYLAQVQTFTPPLANACPRTEDVAPVTGENLARYGANCFDFIDTIPQCTFPTDMPERLGIACRAFVVNNFSHNGCVNNEKWRPSFDLDTWRVYLGSETSLWNDTHDAIRLIDERGLTVDALVY